MCLSVEDVDAVLKLSKVINDTPYTRFPCRPFARPVKPERSTGGISEVQERRPEDISRHRRRKSVSALGPFFIPDVSLPGIEG